MAQAIKTSKTESIKGVYLGDVENERYISKTKAEVVDLISEDGIEGLVHQEYEFSGTEGSVGYSSYTTKDLNADPEKGKLCSIYWNEVPVLDKDNGNFNYTDINVTTNQSTFNASGFVNKRVKSIGEPIKGSEENTTSHYRYYKVYNKYCSKIVIALKVGALGKVDRYKGTRTDPNENYGELLDSSVTVSFFTRPLYSSKSTDFTLGDRVTVQGNFTSPYVKDVELNVDLTKARNQADDETLGYGDFLGWEVQVIRDTEEPKTPDVKNATLLDSITEEIEYPLTAPNSYIIKSDFSAEFFSQVPDRAYDVRLLKVRIPSNYDPIKKTYDGPWNGTWKTTKEWTDNPAWCFHDLITNKRYGLGKYITEASFDKWTLYKIAQYCDTLVSDGAGGLEPRFTCNILIQSREDAFQVLNDMASVFRAIVYYSSGTVYAVQDALKDSVFQFTNANVENGDFNYTTTSAKVRHTVAIVRYNDKENFYKPAVEYVDDVEGIRRHGIKEKEISAFGCTSRGQAIRLGRWILATERLETETVTFTAGTEGALVRPGDVFTVSDSNRLLKRRGGRVEQFTRVSNSQFTILLDSKLEALATGRDYQLTVSAPSFFFDPAQTALENTDQEQYVRNHHVQKFTITNASVDYDSGNTGKSLVTVNCTNCVNTDGTELNLGSVIDRMSWSILGSGVDDDASITQEKVNQDIRYRAINISEKELNKFEIAAVEYREEKYQEIDSALTYENQITFNIPLGPSKIEITNPEERITEHTKAINYLITANANTDGLSYYAVFVKKGSNFTGSAVPSEEFLVDKIYSRSNLSGKYVPASEDDYYFRVYSVNSLNQYSTTGGESNGFAATNANPGSVDPIKDVTITSLRLSDDTGANTSGTSDPVAGQNISGSSERVDFFNGSDLQIVWKTSIPSIQGINISFDFDFRIRIYKGYPQGGTLLRTVQAYRPIDWDLSFTTFELPLEDIVDMTKVENNGSIDLYDAYRDLTFEVDAVSSTTDSNGNVTYSYSSTGNTNGYDRLYVSNPPPSRASGIQGFIDINGNIKVFNVNRPTDAQAVYIIAAKRDFDWDDFITKRNDASYAFHPIKISPITSDDPVFEMDPAFKTDDMEEAYVAIAYCDDFDADVLTYATDNAVTSYVEANKLEARMSDPKKFSKVTPEVMDLIGEGWKAWIKIDQDGNWYGRNIECIEDRTDEAENETFKGYLPFYCGRRVPLVQYQLINDTTNPAIFLNSQSGHHEDYFSASCLYYLPQPPGAVSSNHDYPNTYTNETKLIGGYFADSPNNPQFYTNTTANHPYNGERFAKSFRRFRVHFKENKGFQIENASGGYWVVGMNVNHKPYFDQEILENIGRLPDFDANDFDYETTIDGGAYAALAQVTQNGEDAYIGGSDAFYNYHPAGFVQGWGGLAKTNDYFDIHMGHMIDGSYLKEAIFFVMASTQDRKDLTHNSPCS